MSGALNIVRPGILLRKLHLSGCKRMILAKNSDTLSAVPIRTMFYEADKKGGYGRKSKIKRPDSIPKALKDGFNFLKDETVEWGRELRRDWRGENVALALDVRHGDYEYVFKMNNQEMLNSWVVTSDKDHGEGNSYAELSLTPHNTGIFRGVLNTTVPKDGRVKDAGYCNIKSPKNKAPFKKDIAYDWSRYTHIVMRLRGDGRPMKICLGMDRYFDVNWNDLYQYPLFTRGGPYWQEAKIPFSKFFLTSKGRIQDAQHVIEKDKISWLGVTLSDRSPGPFYLEIDYIAMLYDERHVEDFAYEMYEVETGATY